jgi:hypothetical protein
MVNAGASETVDGLVGGSRVHRYGAGKRRAGQCQKGRPKKQKTEFFHFFKNHN